jgi:penicillin-insensitive murein endopeptidase
LSPLGIGSHPVATSGLRCCRRPIASASRVALGLLLALLTATGGARAAGRGARKKAPPLSSYGSISVGHPNEGVLINSVRLPQSPHWELTVPNHAYATRESVDALRHCISRVQRERPGGGPVRIGSLSGKNGGKLPPHRSHRTGRDADVYFFRKAGARWLEAATRDDIDLDRTWALLRCFITDTDVDFLLIERKLHPWFEQHAIGVGEPPAWVRQLFHDGPGQHRAVVRHAAGHVAHVHVRFVSPEARRLGHELYDRLLQSGLVPRKYAPVTHRVRRGDTLSGLAVRYQTSVKSIQRLNRLKTTTIRSGQKLTIQQPAPLREAKRPVIVPPRQLPP